MTRRKRLNPRKVASELLDANAEMVAVAWRGFWHEEASESRGWWQGVATVHGKRLLAKWIEACPGTRPAYVWVLELGSIPEATDVPADRLEAGYWLEVGRDRFLWAGPPWQRAQGEVLKELGVVDGQELRRHRAWVRRGCPVDYVLDEGWRAGWLWHGCEV